MARRHTLEDSCDVRLALRDSEERPLLPTPADRIEVGTAPRVDFPSGGRKG